MRTPIEIHFYNENNEIVKTYKQHRITWKFLKQAAQFKDANILDESSVDILAEFVCDFYGNKFSIFGKNANKRKLLRHTDVDQLVAVAGAIINRVINIMNENGVSPPNAPTVTRI